MATIANTDIIYVIQTLAETGQNVLISYSGTTVNGVTNATSIGVAVDYTDILERIAISSNTSASNPPQNYSTQLGFLSKLLNLSDASNTSSNSLQTIAGEFVKFNNSINVFLDYVSTIKNTVVEISNTQNDISNTMLIMQTDISEITNRANTKAKGIWTRNYESVFTREQSRALTMAAVKDAGGVDKVRDEINNPTPLPGDEV